MIILNHTAQRTSSGSTTDNYVFQRHLLAYKQAVKIVSGTLLEVGCGEGYGIETLIGNVNNYVGIDKSDAGRDRFTFHNADFFKLKVPELKNMPSNIYDYVISFQVIEHIKKDALLIQEIHRVLKPGGTLLLTTPNKLMSLTRNPWHVREYTLCELTNLTHRFFNTVDIKGVFGNKTIEDHLEQNKKEVAKVIRYDLLNLQHNLPRFLLKIPYDVLNFYNKKKLAAKVNSLVNSISYDDFYLDMPADDCLDFFVIAEKQKTRV